ncbi:MAG: transporter [Betaproteobacteria bacterium]|nr:transporter [Betaproteobacteria bacterium]
MKKQLLSLCSAALCCLTVPAAQAGNLEPAGINLGGTSFFDGFGGTQPGWTYLGYYQFSNLNHIEDNSGKDSPAFKNPSIEGLVIVNQFAYTTGTTLFDGNAHLGLTALLPLVRFSTSFDASSPVKLTSANGVGDLTFGTYLQFNPVIIHGRPVFSQRIELDVVAPVGRYSPSTNINPGSNFWSLVPYWAATWLPTPRTEVSWRVNYLYNFANSSPDALPPTVTNTKAGQAAWVNFTASYAVMPSLNIGLNGYYFKQLTADTYHYSNGSTDNGSQFGDTGKTELFAIGPGLFWKQSPTSMWAANLYFQTQAHNDTRGTVLNIHWTHPF